MFSHAKTDYPSVATNRNVAENVIVRSNKSSILQFPSEHAQRSRICPALAAEAPDIASLIWVTGENSARNKWAAQNKAATSDLDVGEDLIAQQKGVYSYNNIEVAYQKQRIVGCIVSSVHSGAEMTSLPAIADESAGPEFLQQHVPGAWTINAIATHSSVRKQGIGSALLETVEHRARLAKVNAMSLVIDRNSPAVEFFLRRGFRITWPEKSPGAPEESNLGGWVQMTKWIGQSTTKLRRD